MIATMEEIKLHKVTDAQYRLVSDYTTGTQRHRILLKNGFKSYTTFSTILRMRPETLESKYYKLITECVKIAEAKLKADYADLIIKG